MSYDPNQMLAEHQSTWQGFMKLIVYSSVGIAVVLILMAIFLL